MSLSNISQLLIRNIDLLTAKKPLLVNLPDDFFGTIELAAAGFESITYFDTHYGNFCTRAKHEKSNAVFDASYNASIHDLVVIRFPKSKPEFQFTLTMLSSSLADDTPIIIVGENNSGIKSLAKLSSGFLNNVIKQDAAKHCLLFSATSQEGKPFVLSDHYSQYQLSLASKELEIAALPGVFSHNRLDKGTQVLFKHLPKNIQGRVLDFGTGAGVIAAYLGKSTENIALELTDVSALALSSAKQTLELNGLTGEVFATNSLSNVSKTYDVVVSNPPFHQGLNTYYRATEEFLKGIVNHLNSGGQLIIVANSFLKYQPILQSHFSKVVSLANESGFTVYQAFK